MKSISYISGSNGSGNASQMTVQNVRSPGASDIIVNTVTGVPTKFYGSMGEPHTFTDPVTSEIITIISEATAVDFAGHVDSGKIVIDAISPGYVDTRGSQVGDIVVVRPITEWSNNLSNVLSESHNDDGTIKNTAIPNVSDHIQSGGVWSLVSGLNGAMTALVGFQNTIRGTIAALSSRTFTASKDTYIDVLRNSATNVFTLVYTEVANNAASPSLASNSIRLAKIVTSGSAIVQCLQNGVGSLGTGISPISPNTSIWCGFDSLGHPVRPTNPITSLVGASISPAVNQGSMGAVSGVSAVFIADGNSSYRLDGYLRMYSGTTGVPVGSILIDGSIVNPDQARNTNDLTGSSYYPNAVVTPSAGSHTVTLTASGAGLIENSVSQARVMVYKV